MDDKRADQYWDLVTRWAKRSMQAASVLGTVFVGIYFIRIRSVPFDNWAGIAGIAVLIAALSGVFFLSTAVLWGFPAFVFRMMLDTNREQIKGWFYGDRRHSHERKCLPGRIMLWSMAIIAAPWIYLFAEFIPDSFGGLLGAFLTQLACLAASGAVVAFYTLDRPVYAGRQKPRLVRQGTLLRALSVIFLAGSSTGPLLLFCNLLQLSQYEHASGDLVVLGIIAIAALSAMFTNVAAMSYELDNAGSGWRHEAGRIAIPSACVIFFIALLGCAGRLQDRIMEIGTVRISHATLVLKESGCEPLKMVGLLETPAPVGPSTGSSESVHQKPDAAAMPPHAAASHAAAGCVIRDVTVLSHAGTNWPIACVDGDGAPSGPRLSVRADDVATVLTGESSRIRPRTADVASLCAEVAPAGTTPASAASSAASAARPASAAEVGAGPSA